MQVSVNTLQAEILEVEGVAVAIHTAKPGDTFPSYKLRWKTGLDNERRVGAFKRRLEHSVAGHSYSIQKADGDKSVSPFAKMSSLRKLIPA
jgi:hypothetical protein